jgi:hypothetical protein
MVRSFDPRSFVASGARRRASARGRRTPLLFREAIPVAGRTDEALHACPPASSFLEASKTSSILAFLVFLRTLWIVKEILLFFDTVDALLAISQRRYVIVP